MHVGYGQLLRCNLFNAFLNVELSLLILREHSLELCIRQGGLYPVCKELVDLLWCATDEATRSKKLVKLALDGVKVGIRLHALDQVVFETEVFNLVRCFMR